MVVLVGEATKLSNYVTANDKTYEAEITFGRGTDTLDSLGETQIELPRLPENWLDESRLQAALNAELGRELQIPPQFSAIKREGKVAHRQARQGKILPLEPRAVAVRSLEILDRDPQAGCLRLRLKVTKGYYVRSLARDLGDRLDLPSHLSALRRIASGEFRLAESLHWPPACPPALVPFRQMARRVMPEVQLQAGAELKARQGKPLTPEDFVSAPNHPQEIRLWLSANGHPIALGKGLKVLRGLNLPQSFQS